MRTSNIQRTSKETTLKVKINIDGSGVSDINTPVNFLNHMLEAFSKHSLIDISIEASGDIEVDQHHTIEDLGLVLGKALKEALGNKQGINRAGFFIYPMDDALAMVAVDLGGRPYLQFNAEFKRRFCGDLDTDLIEHFFEALSNALGANIVVRLETGKNDHHKLEAIFKALAKSFKMAAEIDPRNRDTIPSTKGRIDDL
jgi:imidazoleglycerol-phosphate dehydratase